MQKKTVSRVKPPMRWKEFKQTLWRFLPWERCYEDTWSDQGAHGSELIWWEPKRHVLLHAASDRQQHLGERLLSGRLYGQLVHQPTGQRFDWGAPHLPARPRGLTKLREQLYDIDFSDEYHFVAWIGSNPGQSPKRVPNLGKDTYHSEMILGPGDRQNQNKIEKKIRSLPRSARDGLARLINSTLPNQKV